MRIHLPRDADDGPRSEAEGQEAHRRILNLMIRGRYDAIIKAYRVKFETVDEFKNLTDFQVEKNILTKFGNAHDWYWIYWNSVPMGSRGYRHE